MTKMKIAQIKQLKGEVPKRSVLDVLVLEFIDEVYYKVSDDTDGIVLSFEQHPQLCKDVAVGRCIRVTSFMRIDDKTIGVTKFSVVGTISPVLGAKSLNDIEGNLSFCCKRSMSITCAYFSL